ncbi:hypothetical protein CEPID_10780 [Corynebacterium epidermidicanis]|uniref:DUF6779 domain-containing protein n=2 Tax=Corynebacterium epidermidicanis TaxID=1050174 RepID=A0A0G3GTW6_9CORY|nr:hypothetical protein CEPID_10780 [Corynebacterium epidermidicanis]
MQQHAEDFDSEAVHEDDTRRGNVMLVALVVLAVVASIVMLFSNSDAAMKIAVLAALWAAFLGLFLVARYRKLADSERARSEAQRRQFESELRREQENFANKQLVSTHSKDTELLEEIREQLAEMKVQLEELSGREFGYEPAALRAEARRIQEIEAAALSVDKQPEPVVEHPAVVAAAKPAETSVVSGKERFTTGSFAAVKLEVEEKPETAEFEVPAFSKESAPADSEDARAEAAEDVEPAEPAQPAEPVEPPARHGRRRRDEKADSVSVAELLANLKKK